MKVAKFKGEIVIAKPILLLAIFELIGKGVILGNRINFSKELAEEYKSQWTRFSNKPITLVQYPYYYLNSEEFYYIKGKTDRKTPSAKFIREQIEFAAFDDELWDLLQIPETREELKSTIIKFFLS